MIKTISIILFLSWGFTFNSYADDGNRIEQLEMEVQELKLRIAKLESLLNDPEVAQKVLNTHEGYKSIANWRKLTTDMGYSEVRNLLGEPQRVDGGGIAYWFYPNGGKVIFQSDEAWRWEEPRE